MWIILASSESSAEIALVQYCAQRKNGIHPPFSKNRSIKAFLLLFISFLLDWATDNALTVFVSRLGRDQTIEGWALDIFPGCGSTTTEFKKETGRVGAKYCPEYGAPG